MQRWFIAGCSAFLFTVVVSTGRGDDTSQAGPPNAAEPYARLISLLSDPDPAVRLDSRERLINQGEAPRPALRKALATADPQTRSEIDRILLHIRWTGFGDNQAVERAFTNYSEEDAETRCEQIDTWLAPLQMGGGTALLRILIADPSPAVRWEAASVLVNLLQENDPLTQQVVDYSRGVNLPRDAYLPPDQNAPLLALGGWLIRLHKPDLAAELMKKALAIEIEHPCAYRGHVEQLDPEHLPAYRGQLDFVIDYLSLRATVQKDYAQLAQLLREQAERRPWDPDSVPEPVFRLFAIHADFGPLPNVSADLANYQDYFGHPEMVYALSRILEHRHQPVPAALLDSLALLMGGTAAETHFFTGRFLVEHGWMDAARQELLCSLVLSNGQLYYAYVELSEMAEHRDDDLAAAKYLEQGLAQMKKSGQNPQDELLAEEINEPQIECRYIRAYRRVHDLSELKTHVEKFMELSGSSQVLARSPEMAADVVPALQDLGENVQADQLFDNAYAAIWDKMNKEPTEAGPKNNLAWLCASAGKKLDEAVKYSDEAVAMDPEDASCLDTQAEAYFRAGHAQRAVEIETHALAIQPLDIYMQRQVERFRAAAK